MSTSLAAQSAAAVGDSTIPHTASASGSDAVANGRRHRPPHNPHDIGHDAHAHAHALGIEPPRSQNIHINKPKYGFDVQPRHVTIATQVRRSIQRDASFSIFVDVSRSTSDPLTFP